MFLSKPLFSAHPIFVFRPHNIRPSLPPARRALTGAPRLRRLTLVGCAAAAFAKGDALAALCASLSCVDELEFRHCAVRAKAEYIALSDFLCRNAMSIAFHF
jgi:hypothetical protein